LNDLPHSRQLVSWRGVMSPQNGHIRWRAKSPWRGSIFKNFRSEAAKKAQRLRTRAGNEGRAENMKFCFLTAP
jgi:hypothetical protein